MDTVETRQVGRYSVQIYRDDYPLNPREDWDNLGTMICFHRRYNLGDKHNLSVEEAVELSGSPEVAVCLPLYLYDHSGITISCSSFSCPWDSGQVGFIYVTHEQVKENFGDNSPESIEKAKRCLEGEVAVYDDFLTGNIYGFSIVDEEGEVIEGCGGFFGWYDEENSDINQEIESIIKNLQEEDNKALEELNEMSFENHFGVIYG